MCVSSQNRLDLTLTMANATNDCPSLLFPETQNCSGRGECLSPHACLCTVPGWTGYGDFAFGSPSCGINIIAIQCLWSFLAFLIVALLSFTIYYLNVKLHQKTRKARFPVILGVMTVFHTSFLLACAILRVSNPTKHVIGTHLATTVMFSLASSIYWVGANGFVYWFFYSTHQRMGFSNTDGHSFSLRTIRVVTFSLAYVYLFIYVGYYLVRFFTNIYL